MTQPSFTEMSDAELRAYVLQNPNNIEAFHAFVDRLHAANPNPQLLSVEEAEAELERKVQEGQR
jgi:hypothetical protein